MKNWDKNTALKFYVKICDVFWQRYKNDKSIFDEKYKRLIIDLEDGYLFYYMTSGKITKEIKTFKKTPVKLISGGVYTCAEIKVIYFNDEKFNESITIEELKELFNQISK